MFCSVSCPSAHTHMLKQKFHKFAVYETIWDFHSTLFHWKEKTLAVMATNEFCKLLMCCDLHFEKHHSRIKTRVPVPMIKFGLKRSPLCWLIYEWKVCDCFRFHSTDICWFVWETSAVEDHFHYLKVHSNCIWYRLYYLTSWSLYTLKSLLPHCSVASRTPLG